MHFRLTVATTVLLTATLHAQWSKAVDISRAPQPAWGGVVHPCLNEHKHQVLFDQNNTAHVFFHAIPGIGAAQLWHTYRTTDGAWSKPGIVSTPGNASVYGAWRFALVDRRGVLHLLFDQRTAPTGVTQTWHRMLDTNRLSAGWTAPQNITKATQPAFCDKVFLDSRDGLHVIFRAVPGTGTGQLFHVRRPSRANWTAPVRVSLATNSFAAYRHSHWRQAPLEDRNGRLHLFFYQVGNGSAVRQLWHRELDITRTGTTWSKVANVSRATQPVDPTDYYVDSLGRTHALFAAIPGTGTSQLFHSYRTGNGAWSTPVRVSNATSISSAYAYSYCPNPFLLEDGRGSLHLAFAQFAGSTRQVWHTSLRVGNVGAGWSTPVNASRMTQPAFFRGLIADGNGRMHVLFNAIPGTGATQLFATYRNTNGSWSTPAAISTNGSALSSAYYQWAKIDRAGRIHAIYSKFVGSTRQVLHTMLNVNNLGAGWSTPANVSRATQPAFFRRALIDSTNRVHVVFNAIPGTGASQLYHTQLAGGPWSTPVRISTGASNSYGYFRGLCEDRAGNVHVTYTQLGQPTGKSQLWHTELGGALPLGVDRTSIAVAVGGTQRLTLRAGAGNRGKVYMLLGTASGTTPGFAYGGFRIPLNIDPYFANTHSAPNQPPLAGSLGRLDTNGTATASFSLPAGALGLRGLTLHHAFVVIDANANLVMVSNAQPLRLQ